MTISSNPTCTEISVQTPDTNLLSSWYSGEELDVDITWSLNDCSDNTVRLPNRYPFDGNISNCSLNSESGVYTFRLNITGITVSNVSLITVDSYTNINAVAGVSQLVYLLTVTSAQFTAGPQITFKIKDTNGNEYTVTYTLGIDDPFKCQDIFIDSINVVYPELPCGVTYDSEGETMTFTYGFFFGGDCEATTELPCGVYNIALESESSCVFVCCDLVCLATSAFELTDLTETLDVYQALIYLNQLHEQGSTCIDCNQMTAIYTYLRSLTKTTNATNSGCGCG
jgi:hypothetical protein